MRRIVAISDFCDHVPPRPSRWSSADFKRAWHDGNLPVPVQPQDVRVTGGYLERLPLAAVAHGLADVAEVWSWAGEDLGHDSEDALANASSPRIAVDPERPALVRRRFRADPHPAPYGSADAVAHLTCMGPPEILCVWGLGVTHSILDACRPAITIYNSIDAPGIRIPHDLARRFDVVLAGGEAQAAEIRAICPDARVAVMPIGPEFASDGTFFPTRDAKLFDVVYVAAAQPYKRHDVLFRALEQRPGLRSVCVVGYGEDAERLRGEATARGLDVTWVGPPGVSHDEVNRIMGRARVGVVCGRQDGAPAIITEYMLAGLPVLANADLCCGLQYIRPDTGLIASEEGFADGLVALLAAADTLDPRAVVQANWTWPHTIRRLADLIEEARSARGSRLALGSAEGTRRTRGSGT